MTRSAHIATIRPSQTNNECIGLISPAETLQRWHYANSERWLHPLPLTRRINLFQTSADLSDATSELVAQEGTQGGTPSRQFSIAAPTIYREIIAPMFRTYWQKANEESAISFRTGHAYTERQLEVGDRSPGVAPRLLTAMCLA